MFFSKNNKGFGLIEAIIGVTMGSLLLLVFMTLITQTMEANRLNKERIQATMYLQEMIEIAKDLEQDPSWTELLSCAGDCHPEANGTAWKLESDRKYVEINNKLYEEWLEIEDVCRDSGDEIKDCNLGDTPVDDTKKIIAKTEWGNLELEIYVYRY